MKPLTEEQIAALVWQLNGSNLGAVKNYRGLVQRGLLRYQWGNDAGMGYVMTSKGIAAIRNLGKAKKGN